MYKSSLLILCVFISSLVCVIDGQSCGPIGKGYDMDFSSVGTLTLAVANETYYVNPCDYTQQCAAYLSAGACIQTDAFSFESIGTYPGTWEYARDEADQIIGGNVTMTGGLNWVGGCFAAQTSITFLCGDSPAHNQITLTKDGDDVDHTCAWEFSVNSPVVCQALSISSSSSGGGGGSGGGDASGASGATGAGHHPHGDVWKIIILVLVLLLLCCFGAAATKAGIE